MFQASAVGAAAEKKPQTQLCSELRDLLGILLLFPSIDLSAGSAWGQRAKAASGNVHVGVTEAADGCFCF